ncbi:unnamed protein product [Miscanthus lutarioriparius]|uniref:Myb/SANT-like domain-containing protein n=1 Tax=Miscanthus lutarioriparius TaxID=422564 RepID=A0A811P6A9_9POAL|nr:unnamed protein product [Miscanthus lutarioriparius]
MSFPHLLLSSAYAVTFFSCIRVWRGGIAGDPSQSYKPLHLSLFCSSFLLKHSRYERHPFTSSNLTLCFGTSGSVVDEVEEVQGAPAQRGRGGMRWTSVMSGFALRCMCQLISSGVRTDKGFKEVHLNQVAKAHSEFTGNEVTGIQVYNHLRKWRQRKYHMISLEEEHYMGHIQAHPKDAEFLNKHIENYQQMMTIFGNGQATGKYAMGSNEPLGTLAEFSDSSIKIEPLKDGKGAKSSHDAAKLLGKCAKDGKEGDSDSSAGNKRNRSMFTEEDTTIFYQMTDAVKDVASAIHETKPEKPEIMHLDLYGVVMYMPSFPEEGLIVAYSHLLDNKAQGDAFVGMIERHHVLWMRTCLAKHYYM